MSSYDQPLDLCRKLKGYFDHASQYEIYDYLVFHGMYQPSKEGRKNIIHLQENHIWEIVEDEQQKLQSLWNGPEIPVFIFPSDSNNQTFIHEFNGKAGLAFNDKLFLFVSKDNSETEIRALFTHEYNHVCRLFHFSKLENEYELLDTLVLEGLAESAVLERYGNDFLSYWMSYYSEEELEDMWKKHVYPYIHTRKSTLKHDDILYGLNGLPKMLGYCVGYYLVQKYIKKHRLIVQDLMNLPSEHFVNNDC